VAQDGSTGTIPEENAGIAISPVNNAGELIGSDYEDGFVGA